MIEFNDTLSLDNDAAHWFIDQATEAEVNVFDFFEVVLTEYYLEHERN